MEECLEKSVIYGFQTNEVVCIRCYHFLGCFWSKLSQVLIVKNSFYYALGCHNGLIYVLSCHHEDKANTCFHLTMYHDWRLKAMDTFHMENFIFTYASGYLE